MKRKDRYFVSFYGDNGHCICDRKMPMFGGKPFPLIWSISADHRDVTHMLEDLKRDYTKNEYRDRMLQYGETNFILYSPLNFAPTLEKIIERYGDIENFLILFPFKEADLPVSPAYFSPCDWYTITEYFE